MSKLPQLPVTELVALDAAGSYALPLSHEQQRLWFLHQADPLGIDYHMAYRIDILGRLDTAAFARALTMLAVRHEALRTHFCSIDGTPCQVVKPGADLPLRLVRLAGPGPDAGEPESARLERLEQDAVRHPFDLSAPAPLMRASLIERAPGSYRLLIVMHHLIGDGWSHALLVSDWCAFYRSLTEDDAALAPPSLEVQFGDYVLWQRRFLCSEECKRQVAHWTGQLGLAPAALQLPPDSTANASGPSTLSFALPAQLAERLGRRLAGGRFLLSALLLAPFELLLARYAHQDQFVIGMAVANRPEAALGAVAGFFVNTVLLPSDVEDAGDSAALLERVQQRLLDVQAHAGAPLDRVLSHFNDGGAWGETPLVKALFVLQNSPPVQFDLPGVRLRAEKIPTRTSKFDLTLFATPDPAGGAPALEFEFQPARFSLAFMESLRDSYLELLRVFWSGEPAALELIGLEGAGRASEMAGQCLPQLHGATIPALFSQQARRTPEEPAMRCEGRSWSYRQLQAQVDSYAASLRAAGAQPGAVLALALPRGPELVVAILGILAAGAAYAPLDPELPPLRLQRMWPALGAWRLVCTDALAQDALAPPRLAPPQLASAPANAAFQDASHGAGLACVIHTSGSTGLPKGVEVEHAGLANVCRWIRDTLQLGVGDICLLKTPLTFDAAARELFPTLISGACLEIAPPEAHRDMDLLARCLARAGATILHCVPGQLRAVLERDGLPTSMRAIMCGGEAMPPQLGAAVRSQAGCALFNVYGPTEATVDALYHRVGDGAAPVPLGLPIPNMQVRVADRRGRPVPRGALGEIHLAGIGLARGYRAQDPAGGAFRSQDGVRWYATGDLARMRPDGAIESMGRIDRQAKRHGVRLEPGAIEAALAEHPAIGAACVLPAPGRLVAFVTPARDSAPGPEPAPDGRGWRAIFDTSYARMPASDDPSSNSHGWVSRAERAPLPVADIVSAARHASERILRWAPRRVLEIGCGTGLILLRVAPRCTLYDGIDFASEAIDYLRGHVRSAGLEQVRLFHAGAGFRPPGEISYDAIVINSVVQYLASPAELSGLLDSCRAWLAADGVIFVGDVRDARLSRAAAWWDRARGARAQEPAAALLVEAELQQLHDPELCLDPAFFTAWADGAGDFAPPLIEAKASSGENELVLFRYDATLARRRPGVAVCAPPALERHGPYRYQALARIQAQLRLLPSLPASCTLAQLQEAAAEAAGPGETPAQALAWLDAASAQKDAPGHWICRALGDGERYEFIRFPAGAPAAPLASLFGLPSASFTAAPLPGAHAAFLQAIETLPQFLRARLASYEMPDQVLALGALPLTAHGKLDRRWLELAAQVQQRRPGGGGDEGAPPTALEAAICEVFGALLGTAFLPDDDFFMMGGNSLLATSAVSRLSARVQADIPLRCLFEAPSARSLACAIAPLQAQGASSQRAPIAPRHNKAAELTRAQYRLWFIEQLGTAPGVYHVCHALRLYGELDLAALQGALRDLVQRHCTLRSRFPQWLDQPHVVIDPPGIDGMLELVDGLAPLAGAEAMQRLRASNARPFDLQRDRLLRISVARVSDAGGDLPCFLLGLVAHHIVIDGWSMKLALEELGAGYKLHLRGAAPPATAPVPDYYDVAAAQNEALARGRYEQHLQYWWRSLDGAPSRLQLPYDHPAPAQRSWAGGKCRLEAPPELAASLRRLAAREHATDFMLLLAAFEVLLSKLSGMEDFVVGTVIANRHHAQYEPLVGMLVNPLALRARVAGASSFAALLGRIRAQMIDAYEHQDAPFETVLEGLNVDRRSDYQAGFQVLFAMQNVGAAAPAFDGLRSERVRMPATRAMFDLSLEVVESDHGWHIELEYSADLFAEDSASLFAERYLHLLGCIAAGPERALAELPLATPRELALVAGWSRGGPLPLPPHRLTLAHLLIDMARRHGDAIALEDGAISLSYAALAAQARALAGHLGAHGVARGQRVGLHLARGPAMAVASLAVHSLGAAVAFLDPSLPAQRLRDLAQAAGLDQVLAAGPAPALRGLPLLLVPDPATLGPPSEAPWEPVVRAGDIAFAGFTSGSSGLPKAVLIAQHAVVRRLAANQVAVAPLMPGDRAAHVYTMNYDGGLLSLFWPLSQGATVVFLPLEILGDAGALARLLAERRITVLDAIPPVLSELFGQSWPHPAPPLRLVVTGGESCPPELPAQVLARCEVVFANQYGPCEAVINATTWVTSRRHAAALPSIGHPLPETDVHIVDAAGRACAIGIAGEILIGGPALAAAYFGAPELTAQKFAPADPGASGQPVRCYHSGDRGRWRADGAIEFLGRIDRQVQIRGMRSDPGEVEAALLRCPEVGACHVALEGEGAGARLAAWVVPRALDELQAADGPAAHRLREWSALFDALYDPELSRLAGPGADLAGWNDSASGEPIGAADMQRWLAATLANLDAWPFSAPPDVLEIGAGLGLVSMAAAPRAASYLATDISAPALERLARMAADAHLHQLECRLLGAHQLDRLGGRRFDLIIMNSVVQYFPSAAFLRQVLDQCAAMLRPGGRVFLGDVRDVRLARHSHIDIARRRHGGAMTQARLEALAAEADLLDEELSLAPGFLHGAPAPGARRWHAVPLLKLDAGGSEMVRYRYDTWLTLDGAHHHLEGGAHQEIAPDTTLAELEHRLRAEPACMLRWRGIGNARLGVPEPAQEGGVLRPLGAAVQPGHAPALDPDQLAALARAAGRTLLVQPGADGMADHFDACFLAPGAALEQLWPQLEPAAADPLGRSHNHPLLGRRTPAMRAAIDRYAKMHLPSHLCPARYIVVDHIAADPAARLVLPPGAATTAADEGPPPGLGNDIRLAIMQDIWEELLGVGVPDAQADFFSLGGHSLLAARLAAAIRREFGVSLPILSIFSLRTMDALTVEVARLHAAGAAVSADVPAPPNWRAGVDGDAPLSVWQRNVLASLAQLPPAAPRHLGFMVELARPLAAGPLASAWLALQEQHPMLQRRYWPDGRPACPAAQRPLASIGAGAGALEEWVAAPMAHAHAAPLELGWMRSPAGATLVGVRAHPAFMDADSVGIALQELVLAERAQHEGQAPFGGRPPADFAAFALWESAHVVAGQAPRRRHAPRSATAMLATCDWTAQEVEALCNAARSFGVSPCALFLGALSMNVPDLARGAPVACPVSLRDALGGQGVLGPFAIDVPLSMDANSMGSLGEAAQMAAGQICRLLESPRQLAALSADGAGASWAFNYQDRLRSGGAHMGCQGAAWIKSQRLLAVPQWHDFKLSVSRGDGRVQMRLRGDAALLTQQQGMDLLDAMRACIVGEGKAC